MTVDFHSSDHRPGAWDGAGFDEARILLREVERLSAVVTACRLARPDPCTGHRRSLSQIASALASLGYIDADGAPYDLASVARLLGQEAVTRSASDAAPISHADQPIRAGAPARRWFDRESLAALLDLGLSRASIARYLRVPEQDVRLLCQAYRL